MIVNYLGVEIMLSLIHVSVLLIFQEVEIEVSIEHQFGGCLSNFSIQGMMLITEEVQILVTVA